MIIFSTERNMSSGIRDAEKNMVPHAMQTHEVMINLSHIVNVNKAVTVLANKERKPYFGLKSLLLLTIITCNLVCNGQLQWKGWAFRGTSCACYHSYQKNIITLTRFMLIFFFRADDPFLCFASLLRLTF